MYGKCSCLWIANKNLYSIIHLLFRLINNPWVCTCAMTKWNQAVTNRMRSTKKDSSCNIDSTKQIKCANNDYEYNYIFDNKLSPRCNGGPDIAQNRSVFYTIRKTLQCKKIEKMSPNKMDKKLYLQKKFDKTIEKQHMQSKQLRELHTNTLRINQKIEHNDKQGLEKYSKKHPQNFSTNYMKKYKMIKDDMNSIDNNIN